MPLLLPMLWRGRPLVRNGVPALGPACCCESGPMPCSADAARAVTGSQSTITVESLVGYLGDDCCPYGGGSIDGTWSYTGKLLAWVWLEDGIATPCDVYDNLWMDLECQTYLGPDVPWRFRYHLTSYVYGGGLDGDTNQVDNTGLPATVDPITPPDIQVTVDGDGKFSGYVEMDILYTTTGTPGTTLLAGRARFTFTP